MSVNMPSFIFLSTSVSQIVIRCIFPLIFMSTLSPFPLSLWGEWDIKYYILPITCTCTFRSSSLVHNPHIRAKLAQLVLLIAGVGSSSRGLLPNVSLLHVYLICNNSLMCFSTPTASVKCLLITVLQLSTCYLP